MASQPITYERQTWQLGQWHGTGFGCGGEKDGIKGVSVVVFSGGNNARIAAFCCHENIDVDGDPHAYGREDDATQFSPQDSLEDGGWLSPTANAEAKAAFEQFPTLLPQLREKLANLPPDTPAKTRTDLSKDINRKTQQLAEATEFTRPGISYQSDLTGLRLPAKYLREKFWKWYGPVALTPEEAAGATWNFDDEREKGRQPALAREARFEDLFGRYPVIQSEFEPAKGYFVSKIATAVNRNYPIWDARHHLQPNAKVIEPYMALSNHLKPLPANLDIGHHVLGVRLDSGASVTMRFIDSAGDHIKVGEISSTAFVALGGKMPGGLFAANRAANNFLVFYIAVPVTEPKEIQNTFAELSMAPNGADLPVMLSFVAQATVTATGSKTPGNEPAIVVPDSDPMIAFKQWKAAPPSRQVVPTSYERIRSFLMSLGYVPTVGTAYPDRWR